MPPDDPPPTGWPDSLTVALDPFGSSPQLPSDKLLQYHKIDHFLDVAHLGHQPLVTSVSDLLGYHKWPSTIPQLH